jgi:hypothetical protein
MVGAWVLAGPLSTVSGASPFASSYLPLLATLCGAEAAGLVVVGDGDGLVDVGGSDEGLVDTRGPDGALVRG